MKRLKNICVYIGALSLFFLGCTTKKAPSKPYNVLWIVADDLGPDIGCYGNELIKTPNLDQLANRSDTPI